MGVGVLVSAVQNANDCCDVDLQAQTIATAFFFLSSFLFSFLFSFLSFCLSLIFSFTSFFVKRFTVRRARGG